MAVLAGVHRLWHVDDHEGAVPHQQVVGREVTVHHVEVEHPLDGPQELVEQILRLGRVVGPVVPQLRCGEFLVADVGHEDRVLGSFDRFGDRHVAIGQGSERLPFAVDPDRALHLPPERGLLLEGHADPPRLDPFAVAVHRLIAEIPPVERVIGLQGQQIVAGGPWVGAAQVDRCFLAALDRSDDVLDQSFVQEVVERTRFGVRVVQRGCSFRIVDTQRCRVRTGAGRERRRRRLRAGPGRTQRVRDVEDRDRGHRSSLLPVRGDASIASRVRPP